MIVTFSCQKDVHVYDINSGLCPSPPFCSHGTVEEAIAHLEKRGKKNISVIDHTIKKQNHVKEASRIF